MPNISTQKVFKVPFVKMRLEQVAKEMLEALRDKTQALKGRYICIVNVYTLMESLENSGLFKAYLGSWFNTADGMPIVWLSGLTHSKVDRLPERVCGPDLAGWFFNHQKDLPMAFIGGHPGQGDLIASRYALSHTLSYSPPMREFSFENATQDWASFQKLLASFSKDADRTPRLIWVGLGAPKQELWMQAVASQAPNCIFVGIGAAFDFHSGRIARSPKWMQKAGLEWVHRLALDPKRLFKKYLRSNSRFIAEILKGNA
jgi:N-acetylglucosaminyldiphosphoundecaprenol N-acetyl-beta-D-mannosaminyltransferase